MKLDIRDLPDAPDTGLVPVADLCDHHFAELRKNLGIDTPGAAPLDPVDAMEEVRDHLDYLLQSRRKAIHRRDREVLNYIEWVVTMVLAQHRIDHPKPADGSCNGDERTLN